MTERRAPGARKYDWDEVARLSETMGTADIIRTTGYPRRAVERIRHELGLSGEPHPPRTESDYEVARRMLVEEGTSYNEVTRTIGASHRWLAKHFPGYGWTHEQAMEARSMYAELRKVA